MKNKDYTINPGNLKAIPRQQAPYLVLVMK